MGIPADYQLVFSDDFNAPSSAWEIPNLNDSWLASARLPENVQIRNGVLSIVTRKQKAKGKEWTTGMIRSVATYRFGYFEARVRYARGQGLNNAFWLTSDKHPKDGGNEIDINEGRYPILVTNNLHTREQPTVHKRVELQRDASENWHTYAALWEPSGKITWYVDGKEMNTQDCPECTEPARVLFSTAIFKTIQPSSRLDGSPMLVDWVRVYQAKAK